MKKNEIKFCGDPQCVWGQTKAKLLDVEICTKGELDSDYVEYATVYFIKNDDQLNAEVPGGLILILTFKGDKRIPFSAIIKATGKRKERYEKLIGQTFDIIIEEEKEIQQELELRSA